MLISCAVVAAIAESKDLFLATADTGPSSPAVTVPATAVGASPAAAGVGGGCICSSWLRNKWLVRESSSSRGCRAGKEVDGLDRGVLLLLLVQKVHTLFYC